MIRRTIIDWDYDPEENKYQIVYDDGEVVEEHGYNDIKSIIDRSAS